MKTINDMFREFGIYCKQSLLDEIKDYVTNYDEDLIERNIEVFMEANKNIRHIKDSDHKAIGKLWKLAQEVYLSNLLDVCREHAQEGSLTKINVLEYKVAYNAAKKTYNNMRKQLGSGK